MARRFSVKHQPGFTTIAMVCFFLLYLPIAMLVVFAFNAGELARGVGGLVAALVLAGLAEHAGHRRLDRSLQIATVAAVIATVAATMAALATTRTEAYRGLTFKYAFINQPLMVPEIVTAVALLIFFSRIKIWTGYSGLGYLIAAHTAFCIPFRLSADPGAARKHGPDARAGGGRSLCHAVARPSGTSRLPLLWPGILAGWMLAFVISLDDVVITEFVKSGGQDTLPTYMLGQIRRVITPEINAISTVFLLLSIAIVTVFFFVSKKRGLKRRKKGEQHETETNCRPWPSWPLLACDGSVAHADGELNIYNWGNYTSPDLIKKFEDKYKVKVTITDYDSNDTALAKVRQGGTGFDIAVPSQSYRADLDQRRPAARDRSRPDGELQERRRRNGPIRTSTRAANIPFRGSGARSALS